LVVPSLKIKIPETTSLKAIYQRLHDLQLITASSDKVNTLIKNAHTYGNFSFVGFFKSKGNSLHKWCFFLNRYGIRKGVPYPDREGISSMFMEAPKKTTFRFTLTPDDVSRILPSLKMNSMEVFGGKKAPDGIELLKTTFFNYCASEKYFGTFINSKIVNACLVFIYLATGQQYKDDPSAPSKLVEEFLKSNLGLLGVNSTMNIDESHPWNKDVKAEWIGVKGGLDAPYAFVTHYTMGAQVIWFDEYDDENDNNIKKYRGSGFIVAETLTALLKFYFNCNQLYNILILMNDPYSLVGEEEPADKWGISPDESLPVGGSRGRRHKCKRKKRHSTKAKR
jgi:hypothetical protein